MWFDWVLISTCSSLDFVLSRPKKKDLDLDLPYPYLQSFFSFFFKNQNNNHFVWARIKILLYLNNKSLKVVLLIHRYPHHVNSVTYYLVRFTCM